MLLHAEKERTVSEQYPEPDPRQWRPQSTVLPSQQPWPAPAAGTRFLSAHDAERSRRWRLSIGIASLILAVAAAFYTYLNIASVIRATNAIQAEGGYVPQSAMATAVLIICIYGIVALAYAAVGIWNIVARRSTSSAPVIAGMVLAAVVVILIVLLLVRSATTGGVPQFGGLATNALVIGRSISVLRLKKEPMPYPGY